jgi:hypothetical protein
MTEIKRYVLMTIDLEYNPGIARPWMNENPNGEWVRWEDVEKLLRSILEESESTGCHLFEATVENERVIRVLRRALPSEKPNDQTPP